MVGGVANQATGTAASASCGDFNIASDPYASIDGGCRKPRRQHDRPGGSCVAGSEAVLGGTKNTASALEATVSGGVLNMAESNVGAVLGGQGNVTTGVSAAIAGGDFNLATGTFDAILGGFEDETADFESTASGGSNNNASANETSVLGGEGNTSSTVCQAIPAAPINSPC